MKISDIPWDSNFTAKNSVLTCESNFQMKMDTQGGSGEGGVGGEGGEQDDSMSASDSYELMRCLWDKCNGCMKEEYENVDSAAFILQTGGLEDQEQQCAHDIAIHCSSEAGKNDASCKGISCASVMACKAKDSNCLCSDPDFANYFDSMMLCDRAVCLDYQHALTTHYASKGYYQPGEKWMERVLRFKNALLYPVSFHFQRNKFVFVCHFHSLTHILVLSLFLLLSLTYTPFNITSSFSFCFFFFSLSFSARSTTIRRLYFGCSRRKGACNQESRVHPSHDHRSLRAGHDLVLQQRQQYASRCMP